MNFAGVEKATELMPTEEMIEAGICKAGEIQNAATSAEFATAIYIAMEAARPATDVSTDGLVAQSQMIECLQNQIAELNIDAAAYDAAIEALQRSNAEKDEALRSIAEGNLGPFDWQANYDRIREVARKALSHSSARSPSPLVGK